MYDGFSQMYYQGKPVTAPKPSLTGITKYWPGIERPDSKYMGQNVFIRYRSTCGQSDSYHLTLLNLESQKSRVSRFTRV